MSGIPFRRKLKNLRKNAERELSKAWGSREKFVIKELDALGLAGTFDSLLYALKHLKPKHGSTISRLGRIALRKNKLLPFQGAMEALIMRKDVREVKFLDIGHLVCLNVKEVKPKKLSLKRVKFCSLAEYACVN